MYFGVFNGHPFQEDCQFSLISKLLFTAFVLADLLKMQDPSNVCESYLIKGVIEPLHKIYSLLSQTPELGEQSWYVSALTLYFQLDQHPQLGAVVGS